jgi:hypothetical protein
MAVDGTAEQPEAAGAANNNTQQGTANGTADTAEQVAAATPPKPGGRPGRPMVSCPSPPSQAAAVSPGVVTSKRQCVQWQPTRNYSTLFSEEGHCERTRIWPLSHPRSTGVFFPGSSLICCTGGSYFGARANEQQQERWRITFTGA